MLIRAANCEQPPVTAYIVATLAFHNILYLVVEPRKEKASPEPRLEYQPKISESHNLEILNIYRW